MRIEADYNKAVRIDSMKIGSTFLILDEADTRFYMLIDVEPLLDNCAELCHVVSLQSGCLYRLDSWQYVIPYDLKCVPDNTQ